MGEGSILEPAQLRRYADAIAKASLGVGKGDTFLVTAEPAHRELAVAVVDAGYRAGATVVELVYSDPLATRVRLEHGSADSLGVVTNAALKAMPDRTRVLVGGIVTHRQRPATARGIIFINMEDETGMVNIVCDPVIWGRHRRVARESGGLLIRGMLEHTKDGVINVIAERIEKLNLGLRTKSRDFR